MMSRPSDFRRLAFSAICMIALGLARPMRRASWGILVTSGGVRDRAGTTAKPAEISPKMVARETFRDLRSAAPPTAGRPPPETGDGRRVPPLQQDQALASSVLFHSATRSA